MKKTGFVLMIGCVFLLTGSALAQGFGKVGSSGMHALKLGIGAKAAAMGESFVAVADDPSALYWNPSGIARLEGATAFASFIQWPAEISLSTLGLIYHLGTMGTVGFSFSALTTGYMNVRTVFHPEGTGEVFSARDVVVGVTFAKNLTDRFSFGGTVKMVQEELEDYRDTAVAFDIGTLYDIGIRSLRLGMAVLNFGPELGFDVDEDGDGEINEDPNDQLDNDKDGLIDEDGPEAGVPLPMAFKVGVSMTPFDDGTNRVVTCLEAVHPNDNLENLNFGVEYAMRDMVFVRGGYRFNTDIAGWTAGLGFKVAKLTIDYAYTDLDYMSQAQRVSVSLAF
ncbi:MAG: PorV/PorQ family protein [Candidatus Latescibacterota bacterium]